MNFRALIPFVLLKVRHQNIFREIREMHLAPKFSESEMVDPGHGKGGVHFSPGWLGWRHDCTVFGQYHT